MSVYVYISELVSVPRLVPVPVCLCTAPEFKRLEPKLYAASTLYIPCYDGLVPISTSGGRTHFTTLQVAKAKAINRARVN